jgi:hypothetical protein
LKNLRFFPKIYKSETQITENMVDRDDIMAEDDYKALLDYRREKEKGKLRSHEQLLNELVH